MSGIFKGDSIYKSGGGGGGYKDGGALIDGDFIKVENNSISTYTNTSRSDINYYFVIKDGEVLNAVIELTNEYNATVHVYILQNGLYIPLGNVGGDTVNAGEQYNINIIGDSFSVEQVSGSNSDPEFAEVNGKIYSLVRIGGQLYTKEDYSGNFNYNFGNLTVGSSTVPANIPGRCVMYRSGVNIGYMYRLKTYKTLNPLDGSNSYIEQFENSVAPFRLPKTDDSIFSVISSTLRTTLNLNKNGFVQNSSNGSQINVFSFQRDSQFVYWCSNSGSLVAMFDYDENNVPYTLSMTDSFVRIRLCIDY